MYIIKLTIYFFLLFIIAVLPLFVGGIFMNSDCKNIKKIAFILGILYIPYFVLMGLTGMFAKIVNILKIFLNLN